MSNVIFNVIQGGTRVKKMNSLDYTKLEVFLYQPIKMIKESSNFEKKIKKRKIDQIQDHGTEFGPILLRRISEDYNIQIN